MKYSEVLLLLSRYLFLLVVAFPALKLFYLIFTPLTVYPVAFILGKLYDAVLFPGNMLFFKGYYAAIIPACVAGAAYYLLFILAFSTPMEISKRIKVVIFTLGGFLLLNITRIVIFAMLLKEGYEYFDITHIAVWYIGSTLIVATLWFLAVFIFNLRAIPFYTDLSQLWAEANPKLKK